MSLRSEKGAFVKLAQDLKGMYSIQCEFNLLGRFWAPSIIYDTQDLNRIIILFMALTLTKSTDVVQCKLAFLELIWTPHLPTNQHLTW